MSRTDTHPPTIEERVEREFVYVRAFARGLGLSDSAAAEVAESVIGDLQRRALAGYDGRSELRTWLGALVTSAAMKARASELPAAPAAAGDEPLDPEVEALVALVADAVRVAIGRLPACDRLLARLVYGDGMTLDEFGVLEGSSKATLSRSVKRVRDALSQDLGRELPARGVTWDEARAAFGDARIGVDLVALLEADSKREAGQLV